jgi:hypothetical protein
VTDLRAHNLYRETARGGDCSLRVHELYREIVRDRTGTTQLLTHGLAREVVRGPVGSGPDIWVQGLYREIVRTRDAGTTHDAEIAFSASGTLTLFGGRDWLASLSFVGGEGELTLDGERDPPFECVEPEAKEWASATPGVTDWTRTTPASASWSAATPAAAEWTRTTPVPKTWTRN